MWATTRHISPLQYAIIETTAFLGIGIFEFPRHLVLAASNNAWWGFLLDWGAAYGGAWILLKVAYINPRETLLGMTRHIWPGVGYWVFGILDSVIHLVLPVIALSQFTYVILTFFLPDSASWMVEVVLMGLAVWVAWWDLPALARTTQVIYIPVMIISLILIALLVPHISQGYAIRPSWDFRMLPIWRGALQTFYIFVGYEVIPIFWPYIRPADQPRARKYTYWSLTFTGIFYAVILAATLGTENPWYLTHLEWPGVSALRLINITGLLIDKLGLLIVVIWGVLSLFFISIRLWAITHVIMPMVRRRTITWYRGIVLGLAVIIVAASRFVPNIHVTNLLTAAVIPYIVLFIFGYPLLFVATAWWRRRPAPLAAKG